MDEPKPIGDRLYNVLITMGAIGILLFILIAIPTIGATLYTYLTHY